MSLVDVVWRLGVVLLLVLANGFFVAAEFALVSVRPTRIDQLVASGNRLASLVRVAMKDPNRFISAAQLGITVASLLLGWVGEETFAEILLVPLELLLPEPLVTTAAHSIATILALVMITLLHITLGEQVPKMIALQRAEATILFAVGPANVVAQVFRPFIALLYWITAVVLRLLGLEALDEEHAVHSPEELRLLVARSARAGAIEQDEREMLDRAFNFVDLTAAEVMIPRTEVTAIPVEASLDDVLELVERHHYSRYPVYERSLDNVVGVLLTKDLLTVVRRGRRNQVSLRRIMRVPVLFVPPTLATIDVLARMRAQRAPLAVVLDEYGGTNGIVTLRDLVERVLGNVGDEFDTASPNLRALDDGSVMVEGLMLVEEFNQRQGAHLDSREVDTLGGLALARLGRMALPGEELDLGNGYQARVERLDGRRVAELRIWPPNHPSQDPESDHTAPAG